MADRLDVDTADLRHAAGRLRWAAGDLELATSHLRHGLAGVAGAIGDDEPGRAFAVHHDEVQDAIVAAVTNLGRVVASMADGLVASAANLDRADAASTIPAAGR